MMQCKKTRSRFGRSFQLTTFVTAGLLSTLLASCGSGSSGGSSGPGAGGTTDGIAPSATITFPPAGTVTEGDMIVVRGTSADVDGIASVAVNGVAAMTTDSFMTWMVEVPLVDGDNDLVVATEDAGGTADPDAASVRVRREQLVPVQPEGAVFDSIGNRVLFLDSGLDSLIATDLTSGARTLISGPTRGTGPALGRPRAMVLDGPMNRVLLADPDTRQILGVDLGTGNRTALAGPFPAPFDPWRLVLDSAGDRLLGTQEMSDEVFQIDLGSGAMSTFTRSSAPAVGGGTELIAPRGIAIDTANDRAIVGDVSANRLVAALLTNGNRDTLASAGSGDSFVDPWDVEVNAAGTLAYVGERGSDTINEVDLVTGVSRRVTGPGTGDGPGIGAIADVMLDEANNRLIVLDSETSSLVFVDIDTGDTDVFSGGSVGDGDAFEGAVDLILRPGTDDLYLADSAVGAIWRVNIATGDRVRAFNTFQGAGPLLRPDDLYFDAPTGLFYAVDRDNGKVFSLNVSTGVREVVTSVDVGSGIELAHPLKIDFDPATSTIYVLDDDKDAVFTVDPANGERTLLSGAGAASGPSLRMPFAMAFDAARSRALVTELTNDAVLGVDETTGVRSIVSSVEGAFEAPANAGDANSAYGPHADIAIDEANGRAILVSVGADGVAAVKQMDLDTGTLMLISGAGVGGGVELVSANGVALSEDGQTAYVLDGARDAIVAVDLASGFRVLVSKR